MEHRALVRIHPVAPIAAPSGRSARRSCERSPDRDGQGDGRRAQRRIGTPSRSAHALPQPVPAGRFRRYNRSCSCQAYRNGIDRRRTGHDPSWRNHVLQPRHHRSILALAGMCGAGHRLRQSAGRPGRRCAGHSGAGRSTDRTAGARRRARHPASPRPAVLAIRAGAAVGDTTLEADAEALFTGDDVLGRAGKRGMAAEVARVVRAPNRSAPRWFCSSRTTCASWGDAAPGHRPLQHSASRRRRRDFTGRRDVPGHGARPLRSGRRHRQPRSGRTGRPARREGPGRRRRGRNAVDRRHRRRSRGDGRPERRQRRRKRLAPGRPLGRPGDRRRSERCLGCGHASVESAGIETWYGGLVAGDGPPSVTTAAYRCQVLAPRVELREQLSATAKAVAKSVALAGGAIIDVRGRSKDGAWLQAFLSATELTGWARSGRRPAVHRAARRAQHRRPGHRPQRGPAQRWRSRCPTWRRSSRTRPRSHPAAAPS